MAKQRLRGQIIELGSPQERFVLICPDPVGTTSKWLACRVVRNTSSNSASRARPDAHTIHADTGKKFIALTDDAKLIEPSIAASSPKVARIMGTTELDSIQEPAAKAYAHAHKTTVREHREQFKSIREVEETADAIVAALLAANITVEKCRASTGSIYLELDGGAAGTIRISDHVSRNRERFTLECVTATCTRLAGSFPARKHALISELAIECRDDAIAEAGSLRKYKNKVKQLLKAEPNGIRFSTYPS